MIIMMTMMTIMMMIIMVKYISTPTVFPRFRDRHLIHLATHGGHAGSYGGYRRPYPIQGQ